MEKRLSPKSTLLWAPILQLPCSLCSSGGNCFETNHFTAAQFLLGGGAQPWSHSVLIFCHYDVTEDKYLAQVDSPEMSCLHLSGVVWLNMALRTGPHQGYCCLGMLHLLCAHGGLGTESSKGLLAALTGASNAQGPQRPPCRDTCHLWNLHTPFQTG